MTKRHDIIWLESVDSTNKEAIRHISELDNLSVLSAFCQSEGRGCANNRWQSDSGKNLTFSIVLKFSDKFMEMDKSLPPMNAYDQFVISEAAALSVIDLLAEYDVCAKVKWPNDIYVDKRKICGILIENSLKGSSITHSVVGVGLNVNQSSFDESIPGPTSLLIETGNEYDIRLMLERYVEILEEYLRRYCQPRGGYARLRKLYLSQMWRKDEYAEFVDLRVEPGERFTGMIKGLTDLGNLVMKTEKGELQEFSFKEISYII